MALLENQTTYGLGGIKEDFDKLVEQGDRKTPFLDILKESTPAMQDKHEWDTETIAAPAANAQIQGSDVTFTRTNVTAREYNYVQTSTKDWTLSTQAIKVAYAGRKSEMKRQQKTAMQELRRDMEYDILNTAARVQGNYNTTAAQSGGIPTFVTTNVYSPTGLSESDIKLALKDIAAYSGNFSSNLILLCDAAVADLISDFAIATDSIVRVEVKGGTLDRRLMKVVTNNGSATVIQDNIMPANTVYLLDMDTWGMSFLKDSPVEHVWAQRPDSKGQSTKLAYQGFFHVMYTLEALDEKRNAIINIQ